MKQNIPKKCKKKFRKKIRIFQSILDQCARRLCKICREGIKQNIKKSKKKYCTLKLSEQFSRIFDQCAVLHALDDAGSAAGRWRKSVRRGGALRLHYTLRHSVSGYTALHRRTTPAVWRDIVTCRGFSTRNPTRFDYYAACALTKGKSDTLPKWK